MDYYRLSLLVISALLLHWDHITAQECADSVTSAKPFRVFGKDNILADVDSCEELFRRFPDQCELTLDNKAPWQDAAGGDGGRCCQTCGDPTCLDKLTSTNTLSVVGKDISDCSEIVNNYQSVCRFDGKPGGRCCRACKSVDTSCVDQLRTFAIIEGKSWMCPEYIDNQPCRCENEDQRSICCASCAKFNNSCACRDTLDNNDPAEIEFTENVGGEDFIIKKKVSNCQTIVNFYAQFCKPGSFAGPKGKCCISCQGVDPLCRDSIGWMATVKKGKKECVDCNCREIRKKSKSLMRMACKTRVIGNNSKWDARRACCLQCKRLGFKV